MQKQIEKFANSRFIIWLRNLSQKLSQSPSFSTISTGMSSNMGIILIGAIVQILVAIIGIAFKITPDNPVYQLIYMPYKVTMGILALFMTFSLAHKYTQKLKVKSSPVQAGFIAIISYILVAAPIETIQSEAGAISVINIDNLGAKGLFIAIIIGLLSVRITKFAIDKDLVIKMPESVPQGVIEGFNSVIPALLNIIVWYGLTLLISYISKGAFTLSSLITFLLAYPVKYLESTAGMVIILLLAQLFWFFGIHGTSIIMSVVMVPLIAAYTTNSELAAQNLPLVYSAMFLFGANGSVGGAGNTLPIVLMGLKSKSKQIKAVSKASLIPSIFGINEPVVFGFPIMYNPILMIPFLLAPIVYMVFLYLAYHFQLISLPHILVFALLPMGVGGFMNTLDIRNAIMPFVMLPVMWLVWYPFYKIYEKDLIKKEQEMEKLEEENKLKKQL